MNQEPSEFDLQYEEDGDEGKTLEINAIFAIIVLLLIYTSHCVHNMDQNKLFRWAELKKVCGFWTPSILTKDTVKAKLKRFCLS